MSTSSVKSPDPIGRKALGGTNGSSSNKSCSLESQGCDRDNDRSESSGGVGGLPELANGDDDCIEPGGKLMNSVIVDQSTSRRRSEGSAE